MLDKDIKEYVNRSVLCWMATANAHGVPNVSPKEVFTYHEPNKIIVANIASPGSAKNIMANDSTCISFIDVFVQKGYQLKGSTRILRSNDDHYEVYYDKLSEIAGSEFSFHSIFEMTIEKVKKIIAPRYILYPNTTEEEQVSSAYHTYGIYKD